MQEVQCWRAWLIFLSLKKRRTYTFFMLSVQNIFNFGLPLTCSMHSWNFHSTNPAISFTLHSHEVYIHHWKLQTPGTLHQPQSTVPWPQRILYIAVHLNRWWLTTSKHCYDFKTNHFLNTHHAVVWGIWSSLCAHCIGLHHDYVDKQAFKISYNIYTKIFLMLSS